MSIFLSEMLNDYETPRIFLDNFDPTSFGAIIDCYNTNGKKFYVRYYANGQTRSGKTSIYHAHGYNQLSVHLNGKTEISVNGKLYERIPGDVSINRAGVPHGASNILDDNLEYLQLDFPLDAFDNINSAQIFVDVFKSHNNLLIPDPQHRNQILKCARKIIGILGSEEKNKLLVYSYIIQLMYTIDSALESKNSFILSDKLPNIVFEAVQYIYSNLESIESVEEIANHVNVCPSYLTRLFKANLGFTPYGYLTDRRIENAKILMCYKGENVSEACRKAGFKDYSNFIALFKKRTGMTPLAYKKANS